MLPRPSQSPTSTPLSPQPRKLLHGCKMWMQCSQWMQSDKADFCHVPPASWAQPQQGVLLRPSSAGTPGRAALAKPAPEQLQGHSHSQRRWPHKPWLDRCPRVTDGRVGSQPLHVPNGWQDTSTLTPRRSLEAQPLCSSPAGSPQRTDRRDRVPHSPTSPKQLPLPWEEGHTALEGP